MEEEQKKKEGSKCVEMVREGITEEEDEKQGEGKKKEE